MVTLAEMKGYLRVDFDEDDALIQGLLLTAEQLCSDLLYENLVWTEVVRTAVLYATAYLYEHREDADYNKLLLTLRSLLFGEREVVF